MLVSHVLTTSSLTRFLSSFCLAWIHLCPTLLFPLSQLPAVRGFSLIGSGAMVLPPGFFADFPSFTVWTHCRWDTHMAGGWKMDVLHPPQLSFLISCTSSFKCPASPFCPTTRLPFLLTFPPSASLLPCPPYLPHLPSFLTSSCPPLPICRKH